MKRRNQVRSHHTVILVDFVGTLKFGREIIENSELNCIGNFEVLAQHKFERCSISH